MKHTGLARSGLAICALVALAQPALARASVPEPRVMLLERSRGVAAVSLSARFPLRAERLALASQRSFVSGPMVLGGGLSRSAADGVAEELRFTLFAGMRFAADVGRWPGRAAVTPRPVAGLPLAVAPAAAPRPLVALTSFRCTGARTCGAP